jgi:hypothetical protein
MDFNPLSRLQWTLKGTVTNRRFARVSSPRIPTTGDTTREQLQSSLVSRWGDP